MSAVLSLDGRSDFLRSTARSCRKCRQINLCKK